MVSTPEEQEPSPLRDPDIATDDPIPPVTPEEEGEERAGIMDLPH